MRERAAATGVRAQERGNHLRLSFRPPFEDETPEGGEAEGTRRVCHPSALATLSPRRVCVRQSAKGVATLLRFKFAVAIARTGERGRTAKRLTLSGRMARRARTRTMMMKDPRGTSLPSRWSRYQAIAGPATFTRWSACACTASTKRMEGDYTEANHGKSCLIDNDCDEGSWQGSLSRCVHAGSGCGRTSLKSLSSESMSRVTRVVKTCAERCARML